VHGYIAGEHKYCPYEHTEEELERFGVEITARDADYDKKIAM
jgi:hypothetical protein